MPAAKVRKLERSISDFGVKVQDAEKKQQADLKAMATRVQQTLLCIQMTHGQILKSNQYPSSPKNSNIFATSLPQFGNLFFQFIDLRQLAGISRKSDKIQ